MRRVYVLSLVLELLLVLAGSTCGGKAGPVVGGTADGWLETRVRDIQVTLKLDATLLRSGVGVPVDIALTDPSGQAIPDAGVVAILNSATHGMAPDVLDAAQTSHGGYTGVLTPRMKGPHYITIDFRWKSDAYQARFDGLDVE